MEQRIIAAIPQVLVQPQMAPYGLKMNDDELEY